MSTLILLSSSPPPVFARSPTVVQSSSPLPSTAALVSGESPSRKRFRVTKRQREGFPAAFSTARQVLADKNGAENAKIGSHGRHKFVSSQSDSSEELKDKKEATSKPKEKFTRTRSSIIEPADGQQNHSPTEGNTRADPEPQTDRNNGKTQHGALLDPLLLEKAITRRLDWTPPKAANCRQEDEKPVEYSAGFMNGMLNSFTYDEPNTNKAMPQHVKTCNSTKRRRVETAQKQQGKAADLLPVPRVTKTASTTPKIPTKRVRSPGKKSLTITGLATSNYLGVDDAEESPIMQYLTSTQAQLSEIPGNSVLETKIKKTKAAVQKSKAQKKSQPKSLLLSPQSAMKAFDNQDTIFGSASQLAREESPTFLRETIEALKQSESFLTSDLASSPQRTQPLSLENTPQKGTTRFKKTRNLWAAAGRDDDNALLHVDTIDLTDTPAIRAAFAGKDVLLQPAAPHSVVTKGADLSLRGGYSPLEQYRSVNVVDIGDLTTPCAGSTRPFCSTTSHMSPRKSPSRTKQDRAEGPMTEPQVQQAAEETPPLKPNYVGFSTQDLNKLIKSYGFKAMRKREKMIELLDRCWEEKYGPSIAMDNDEPQTVPFGDFLSKVHGISERPEPKVSKPRARKPKDKAEKGTETKSAAKPRQRKKKDTDTGSTDVQEPVKPSRKRKSKTVAFAGAPVFDIDGIADTIPEDLRNLQAFDDWAKPQRRPKAKVTTQPTATIIENLSPSPQSTTLIQADITVIAPEPPSSDVSPVEITNHSDSVSAPDQEPPTSKPSSIPSQITAAVLQQSKSPKPGTNHNTNPTWHEKILLYDPIILEDLASWLNTEGFGLIGEDREVSALEVRAWCEDQGICCLWRGGWRGNKLRNDNS